MPFNKEFASGESLIWLQNSEAIKRFDGIVARKERELVEPELLEVARRGWVPKRVIAVDGSNVTHKVQNGFPGAEASLISISVVRLDITQLAAAAENSIPRPSVFHEMERAATVDAVLPGANVVRRTVETDTPAAYFREELFRTLDDGTVSRGHETLLDTLRVLTAHRKRRIGCPISGCGRGDLPIPEGQATCPCGKEVIFETDSLRLDERFNEIGSNGEVHGEFRHLLEVLVLLNILRYFARPDRVRYLRDTAFVLDGPLAMFGHTAWLTPYIRDELDRINLLLKQETEHDLALFGFEKSGRFYDHFEDIDWSDVRGPRGRLPARTLVVPNRVYINRNIVFRPDNAKPHGADTYFGRKLLYKTRSGDHAVINTAMLTPASRDFDRTDAAAFPRVGDILDVMDHLSTYLYDDGFMPLVRAHAHAAIPLQKGADLLSSLFEENKKT